MELPKFAYSETQGLLMQPPRCAFWQWMPDSGDGTIQDALPDDAIPLSIYETPRMPSPEQCEQVERVPAPPREDGGVAYACWYPQMGGYVSRCIVVLEEPHKGLDHGCFNAYVWHDGSFPFDDTDRWGDPQSPARIHHCNPQQFINFGNMVKRLARLPREPQTGCYCVEVGKLCGNCEDSVS